MTNITCYTDGSAVLTYPYKGGIGVYIKTPKKNYKISKGFCGTKTGRMELTAVIYCLRAINNKQHRITIYSDSMYVVNTCNQWIDGWERKLWRGVKNVDLLKQLIFELRRFAHRPRLIHIKGHQEVVDEHTEGNSIVDELASYKSHTDYEVDVPLSDITELEKGDFYEKNGKMYYDNKVFNK